MNLEVFCYLGLLRFPEQLEPSLALLPDRQRVEAASFLATVKELPKAELLWRWSKLRDGEYTAMRRNARELGGIQPDKLPPSLRDWCASWLADRNG